jgi:hypothetical protein
MNMTNDTNRNKPGKEHRFFCAGVERPYHSGFPGGVATGCRKADGRQQVETFLGLRERLGVIGVT